jgi:nucleoid-associated protein YgaU
MGLIDFVKNAGKKLVGADDREDEQAAARHAKMKELAEQRAAGRERHIAAKIVEQIRDYGFQVSDLSVRVDDEVVTVKGTVPNQDEREKIVLAAGNNQGIARVDDQLAVSGTAGAGAGGGRFHTVESGDTLSKISKKYYGDANQYNKIFEANRPMLSDPDKIYPGQVLRIPA